MLEKVSRKFILRRTERSDINSQLKHYISIEPMP